MRRLYDHQPSFSAGVLSPALYGRTDFQKFAIGLAVARNFYVRAQGGASNRPGLEFILDPRDQTGASMPVRVIPFEFSTEQTYALVLTHEKMFVVKDGEPVVGTPKDILALTPGAMSAYPMLEFAAPHGWSVGDLIYLTGVTNCPGGPYVIVSTPTSSQIELGSLYANNYPARSDQWALGATPIAERVYSIVTPWTSDQLFDIGYAQSADVMTLCHPAVAPRKLSRTGHSAWTLTTPAYGATIAAPTGVSAAATAGTGSYSHQYKVTAVSASNEESVGSATASVSNTASLNGTTAYNTVTWSSVTGASFYYVYKLRGGVFGYIGTATGTSFIDDGVIADQTDTPPTNKTMFSGAGNYPACVTYYQQRQSYGGSDAEPQKIYMSQSGNYYNHNVSIPSKDDDGVSFEIASNQVNRIRHLVPLKDLLVFTSGGEWLVRGASEDVITPSSIYAKPQGIRGSSTVRPLVIGDTVLYIEPNGAVVRDFSYELQSDGFAGSNLTVLAEHLFEGATIVDWCYQQYPSSIVWAVLSTGKMLGLTYMREHDVWAWHEHETDGLFKSVCCIREGQYDVVYAVVARTETYGPSTFTRYFVERMHERNATAVADHVFLDSCYVYRGAAVDELDGLDWLDGRTLNVLADGSPHPAVRVQDGKVTLQVQASTIAIGLPYRAVLQSLPLSPPEQYTGRTMSVSGVKVRVLETGGFKVGPSLDDLSEHLDVVEQWDAPIGLHTLEAFVPLVSGWDDHPQLVLVQDAPLPCNVLTWTPRVSIGG